MDASRLTTKGQLLIPKCIRNKYGITAGVKIIFEEIEKGLLIRPMNADYFKSFRGILKSTGNLKEDIKEMREEEKKREERKLNLLSGKGRYL